jgi:hypothetical protein
MNTQRPNSPQEPTAGLDLRRPVSPVRGNVGFYLARV